MIRFIIFIANAIKCECNRFLFLVFLSFSFVHTVSAQVQFENDSDSLGGPFYAGDSWGASWGHMDGDVYPDLYTSNHGSLGSLLLNNSGQSFVETIHTADQEQILVSEPHADVHGGTWADFDNDGDQDLFVTRSSVGARVYLFENDGNGLFQEKGGNYGVGGVGGGRMPVLFDYTNDGRLDINISRNGGNRLFEWEGNKFKEQTNQAGIGGECHAAHSGVASDFFNTGSLYYLCLSAHGTPYAAYDTSTIPFADVSSKFDRIGTTPDTILGDFNNDLKMDIVALRGLLRPSGVAKVSSSRIEAWLSVGGKVDYISSFTFKSNGPITINVAARTVAQPNRVNIGSSGYHPSKIPFTVNPTDSNNWGVSNNLDQFAVFVEYDQISEEWTIYMSAGGSGQGEGAFITVDGAGFTSPSITGLVGMDLPANPRFLINNGDRLVDSFSRGIDKVQCGGISAADFDNDMDLDLYLTCRSSTANTENLLYLNDGSGNFSKSSSLTGAEGLLGVGVLSGAGTAESTVTADYNVDGLVDLFVTNGNRLRPRFDQDGYAAGGSGQFYKNTTQNSNHWLEIDLEGVNSNRDGFGAKVFVTAGGVSQLREQNGQYHRWSHDHKRLHFGLANNATADIRVEWPDGTEDLHANVDSNGLYKLTQNGALINITPNAPTADVNISIENVSIIAGNDAELTISLSEAVSTPISIDYVTEDGTAVSGSDYIISSGTITFNPNQISKTLIIPTVINDPTELEEEFAIILSNPSPGAVLQQSTASITIEASDSVLCGRPDYLPKVDKGLFIWVDCASSDDWHVRTTAGGGDSTLYQFEITSNNPFNSVTPISFEGSDFFELLNSDKLLKLQNTMINGGQDGVSFSLIPGSELCLVLNDPTQTIYLGANRLPFLSPLNVKSLNNNCGIDFPGVSVSDAVVSEGDNSASISLTLNEASSDIVTVSYTTVDGSAIAGEDYSFVSGSINFQPSQIVKTISIPILQDSEAEQQENLFLEIGSATNADIIDSLGEIIIDDDDATNVNACGEPIYSSATDAGIFLWQDCAATNKWFVRGTAGGGPAVTYIGTVISDSTISSLTTFSFEGIDSADLVNSDQQLVFLMKMSNKGIDGIEFATEPGNTCFDLQLPNNLQISVGQNNELISPPFDLITFEQC